MESIGARLKQVRLEKGFTLEEVHKKTKIHLNILKAIEEDSLVNFSPVYIKGFIKIYAKFLGVPLQDFVPGYQEAQAQLKPKFNGPERNSIADLIKAISGKIKIILPFVFALLIAALLFNIGKFIFIKSQALFKKHPVSVQAGLTQKKEKKTTEVKSSKVKTDPVSAKPIVQEAVASGGIRLGARAKEDCWMSVKLDGKIIFQNILKKGRFENWKAKEKIELSLGNAQAVELEVNGKFISSLGRRGQALKNILITKEGLVTQR